MSISGPTELEVVGKEDGLSGPGLDDPSLMLSALRRVDGRAQMRVYTCGNRPAAGSPPPFRIELRELDF